MPAMSAHVKDEHRWLPLGAFMPQIKNEKRNAKPLAVPLVVLTSLACLIVASLRQSHQQPAAKYSQPTSVEDQTRGATQIPSLSLPTEDAVATQARISEVYGKLPLQFEANQGQTDARVKFVSRNSNYNLFLTSIEAVLTLNKPVVGSARKHGEFVPRHTLKNLGRPAEQQRDVLRIKLIGANANADVVGQDELPGKSNYFIGNDPAKWRTNISNYRKVQYRNLYEGVDLVYYGDQHQLEYDFVVAPHADPAKIRLSFKGALRIQLDAEGNLILRTRGGSVSQRRPSVYQELDGGKEQIAGGYKLLNQHEVAFKVGDYDRSKPLVIDPVLAYSTYLGGGADESGMGMAVDADGNAYVSGSTSSVDFPATTAFSPPPSVGGLINDAFVAKLNPSGTALVYAAYLGGSNFDEATRIAVDSSENVYVTGDTTSVDFPTTPGAYRRVFSSGNASYPDAFVTKLNATGSALVYSTYLGGLFDDVAFSIALDSAGQAYVTGGTDSFNFPVTSGVVQPGLAGEFLDAAVDAFLTKVNADGSGLVYSTFLGGADEDFSNGIAVDSAGNACVTGITLSTDFPIFNAIQPTFGGGVNHFLSPPSDAFVTKLNANGSAFIYSTYLGGSDNDGGLDVAADPFGSAYVTGATLSTNFPTTPGAFDRTCGTDGQCNPTQDLFGGPTSDSFVTKLNASGSGLLYSTYLGGSSDDVAQGIAVDSSEHAYVTGLTSSDDFPTTPDALSAADNGFFDNDAFATKLNPSGSALDYSTLIASSGNEEGTGIALDPLGNIYCTGNVTSSSFPTTVGALRATSPGDGDAFILKLDFSQSTPLFRISGRVIASAGGGPFGGVTVTLTGSRNATTTTDPNGNYFFDVAQAGNYTVTPSKTNLVFNPYSRSFNSLSADQNANFTATAAPTTYSVSGFVNDPNPNRPGSPGIPGVTLKLSDPSRPPDNQDIGTTLSDRSGKYTFTNLAPGGTYTVTPTSQIYTFDPPSQTVTNLSGNQLLNQFKGAKTFDIFSLLKDNRNIGVTNACVTLTDAVTNREIGTRCRSQTRISDLPESVAHLFDPDIAEAEVICDAGSIYAFSDLPPGTYIVKPTSPNYTFSPPSFTVVIGTGSQGGIFIANPFQTYSVSGRLTDRSGVGIPGARVLVCGTRLGKTDADGDGRYSFPTMVAGDHINVQPSLGDMTFNPQWRSFINLSQAEIQDFSGAFNQIDNAQSFVRQHYLDFLSREPDQGGLDYWTGRITECNLDLSCVHSRRVAVSDAFFFEPEFQQTGSYVYRLYRAAYGNTQPFANPDANPQFPGENLKVPSYALFVQDRARVVGGAGLAQSQLDLANAFVQRQEFLNKYPASLATAGEFVDAVLATLQNDLGVNLSSERSGLVDLYNQGGRGAVLYRLADDNAQNPINNLAFLDEEYNRAFVATEYFGYLRRDADIGGLLFWLGQVNRFPLREIAIQHAMVCSFVTSIEYQQRFGPEATHSNGECPQ
jgi:hypothetical protein